MKYDNSKCPICGETFNADSDVVVCPECGTPHHRACYEELGHCKNSDKHEDGFMWHLPESPISSSDKSSSKAEHVEPPKIFVGGTANRDNAPNGAIPGLEIDQEGRAVPVYRAVSPKEKIGDYTVEDYGKVVKKNNHKYMPRFIVMDKTKRKASWNWAAFLFGPAWLMYRKMYKYGIVALLVTCILPLIFIGDVIDYQKEYAKTWNELSNVMMADSDMTEADLTSKTDAIIAKAPQEPTAMVIASYIQLAVGIVLGVFGNYLYKEHCNKLLKSADSLKENPDEREKFLDKKGGSSLLSMIIAYFALFVLVSVVTYITVATGTDLATILRRYI